MRACKLLIVLLLLNLLVITTYCACNKQEKDRNIKIIEKSEMIRFEKIKEIELANLNVPPLGLVSQFIILDSSFVFLDYMTSNVHQYGFNGEFIRIIGSSGKGPGEYMSPNCLCPYGNNQVIISESLNPVKNLYDSDGAFIPGVIHITPLGIMQMYGVANDDVIALILGDNMRLTRLSVTNSSEKWSAQPWDQEITKIIRKSPFYEGICYNPSSDKIYYQSQFDYIIHEIDNADGSVLRSFGKEPKTYMKIDVLEFPNEHLSIEEISKVDKYTRLANKLVLLEEKYLFHGYATKTDAGDITYEWFIYDISLSDPILYKVDFPELTKWNILANTSDYLFAYRSPSAEDIDDSNGVVAIYSIERPKVAKF